MLMTSRIHTIEESFTHNSCTLSTTSNYTMHMYTYITKIEEQDEKKTLKHKLKKL